MTEAGQLVHAEETRQQLFASLSEWLGKITPQIPVEVLHLRRIVALQQHPVMARLVMIGKDKAVEVARATEEDLPNAAGIADALELFLTAGLSAIPEDVTASVFHFLARPGGGLIALADPVTGSVRALFAPRGVSAERWVELFEIAPARAETMH